MTNFLGKNVIESIKEQDYVQNIEEADGFSNEFAIPLVENLSLDRINRSAVTFGDTTVSVEIAPQILPLRYKTEYKKIIRPEEEIEPRVILIYESPNISKSHMKVELLTDDLQQFIDNRKEFIGTIKNKLTELYELDQKLTLEAQTEDKEEVNESNKDK